MFSKEKIYNLALGHLLLNRRVTSADTDESNEVTVLNDHYDVAFEQTLADLDLDSMSEPITLELVTTDPNDFWGYVYKYPPRCAFFRRIQSPVLKDSRSTHLAKRVGLYNGQKSIFTNEADAIAECIVNDVPLGSLAASVGLCISYKLAVLASSLITGKGSKDLKASIEKQYIVAKAEAQERDQLENFVYTDEATESEFVYERTT